MNCSMNIRSLGFILLFLNTPFPTNESELLEVNDFRRRNPHLTEFLKIISTSSPSLTSLLEWNNGTLLAPTNEAIRNHRYLEKLQFTNATLMYHYSAVPLLLDQLEDQEYITSDLRRNPPIWITKTHDGSIFLNDAKVLSGNLTLKLGSEQIVHVIDKVLEPAIPKVMDFELYNPTARQVVENSANFMFTPNFLTTKFAKQMNKVQAGDLLGVTGRHTYLIPVDDAFMIYNNITYLDRGAICGHIIPNRAIFLRTIENRLADTYKTLDLEPDSRVFISFTKEFVDGKETWIVKSDNREGEKKGVVLSQIVKGNIPVQNGVLHLISNPLVIIDKSVYATLRHYATQEIGNMKEFFNLIERVQMIYDFRGLLEGTGGHAQNEITLFVPSNRAIRRSIELGGMANNKTAIAELIEYHILTTSISEETIIQNTRRVGKSMKPYQVQTIHEDQKLYFHVIGGEGNRTVFVEGGGVNAKTTQLDLGATNGFIHIIDKVLVLPDDTIVEKLRSHPLLQTTYGLWMKENFNEWHNSLMTPITFFAPSELAWKNLRFKSDETYHNILQGNAGLFGYQLLQRHILVDQDESIEYLQEISNLTSLNADLKVTKSMSSEIESNSETTYYVNWKKISAFVIRTDLKCTNGIIHIIDQVFIDDSEIDVLTSASVRDQFQFEPVLILTSVFVLLKLVLFL